MRNAAHPSVRQAAAFLFPLVALLVAEPLAAFEPPLTAQGFPTNENFFPLAVWVQNPRNAERYRDLGINVFVALYRGPTVEQLDLLDKAGVYAITHQGDNGLKHRDRGTIAAWMHGDEPDNAQSLGRGKGYGPPITTETVVERYRRMKQTDPGRPVLLNLGQGVAWDNWIGRGVRRNHPEDYPKYLEGCDIASFDIYPVTNEDPEVAGKLESVGRGVARLVEWTGGKKPVWCCIETTHIHNEKARPTPAQVKSEVWIALVHGATGIIYFCHEFKPQQVEAGLLMYPEIMEAVKAINAQVKALAPVLNSPTVRDAVAVTTSDADVPVATLCKRHAGATYVLATSLRGKDTTASFAVKGIAATAKVEVLGESRTLGAKDGRFDDRFDGYGVHLYRITAP